MSKFRISRIYKDDCSAILELDELLKKEGLKRDENLDYTIGLYDHNDDLAATGSCFQNTLRCLAVDTAYHGEGLLNQIVSHLADYQYQNGRLHLFLYTKRDSAKFFTSLGFYEIAQVDNRLVFMENRKTGFTDYLKELKQNQILSAPSAAVIINANPFTLGHQYLLETAAKDYGLVHVFVVSEDVSLFSFKDRFQMVKEGTKHIPGVICHTTGNYMISNATFPSYFLKDSAEVIESHAKLDIEIFKKIAGALGIVRRFVGEEPFSRVTGIYNTVMKQELERSGIEFSEIKRKKRNGMPISASNVRNLLHDGDFEAVKHIVPDTTYRYLTSGHAAKTIDAIKASDRFIHY